MALMSSGEFARTSGLTRKALRLYDELGLLTPARVDPQSGYRFYAPAQLEQARLVAWLRRLGMPLASIRAMGALSPAAAAVELAAYWERVEAETASRRELASFLIGYLSGRTLIWNLLLRRSSPCGTRCGPTSGLRGRTTRTPPTPAADCSPSPTGWAGTRPGRSPARR